jgi:methionyl-tRNA formyltransferase
LVDAMDALQSGTSRRIVQDEKAATYARKLTRDDARIDWTMPAIAIHNRVRGFSPWPGATCLVPRASGRQIKVLRTTVETAAGSPGTVLDITGEGPLVAAGTGSIRLLEIQPVGKTTMSGRAFLCGTPLTTSDVVG